MNRARIIFAIIGMLLIAVSTKLPNERVQIASRWTLVAGAFMFAFGWVYPHFLDLSTSFSFIYSSPTGVIPCATLSIGIGLTLLLNRLNSRKLSTILGISGIIFGITGIIQLGVIIDLFLLLGAATIMFFVIGESRFMHQNWKPKTSSVNPI